MPAARRKAPKLPVPDTTDAAIALLGEFARTQAALEGVDAKRRELRATIDEEADRAAAPLEVRLKTLFSQLKPWWAVSGPDILGSRRKSTELGGCLIGWRLTTPRLAIGKMTVPDAIEALLANDFEGGVRVRMELDKPNLLTCLGDDSPWRDMLVEAGFSKVQREEFFIDPLPMRKPATVEIAEPLMGEAP